MTIQQGIEKAIEGGYQELFWDGCKECGGVGRDDNIDFVCTVCKGTGNGDLLLEEMSAQWERFTSDPLFWQSLGKAMGWREEYPKAGVRIGTFIEWKQMWHRFIDHLAEGKDAESFFENLR